MVNLAINFFVKKFNKKVGKKGDQKSKHSKMIFNIFLRKNADTAQTLLNE